MSDTSGEPPQDKNPPLADDQTQDQPEAKKGRSQRIKSLTGKDMLASIAALPGRFLSGLGAFIRSPLGILGIFAMLVYAFVPIDRGIQFVESKLDDLSFEQSREGLIVVDTPQLFTRERLINERLEESAWINDQLKKVDELLQKEKFAQVDSISFTKSLLSVLGKNGASSIEANDFDNLGELAEKLGATKPTPLQQFRDAKNYRERLSLQRYESILDDAHDIGSNTLHRMNFRLTLSPARSRSDSVAAVSITVREPSEARLLFDHYGRLVVETRKKMEETVYSMLRDRSLILQRPFPLQASELALIDRILEREVRKWVLGAPKVGDGAGGTDGEAKQTVDRLVDLVLKQQILSQEKQAREYLFNLIKNSQIPGLGAVLMPEFPGKRPSYWNEPDKKQTEAKTYSYKATKRVIASCGTPFRLTKLAFPDVSLRDEQYIDLEESYIAKQMRQLGSKPPTPATGSAATAAPAQTPEDYQAQQKRKMEAMYGHSRKFNELLNRQYNYPCPNRKNQTTVAKLRLIGRLAMLSKTSENPQFQCKGSRAEKEKLIAYIGGSFDGQSGPIDLCPGSELAGISQTLADRVSLIDGEYAQIGVVLMLKEKLNELPSDTSTRTTNLGKFFVFDSPNCDLSSCELRTRTIAEKMRDDANRKKFQRARNDADRSGLNARSLNSQQSGAFVEETAAVVTDKLEGVETNFDFEPYSQEAVFDANTILSQLDVIEAGREESLRLFLELKCFADARSYTVWPRSAERLASFDRESIQAGARFDLDSTLQKYTGFEARNESGAIARSERDHIFGIGDWGSVGGGALGDTEPRACSRELQKVLDAYEINGRFLEGFVDVLRRFPKAELGGWWAKVEAKFASQRQKHCGDKECDVTLDALIEIAQDLNEQLNNTETKFSWIIAPRRQSARSASRHVPMSVPLSALISLPSWWGHAELEIATCWVRPKDLKDRIPTGNLCGKETKAEIQASAEDDISQEIGRNAASSESGSARHEILLPLPGKAQDVLQRIGFFIIRTPYLETNWQQEEEVEAGRSAQIRLTGSRLWKNPRVRIGNQWHDKLEVLPNMQGVIATFECVQPTLRPDKLSSRLRHEELPHFGVAKDPEQTPSDDCETAQGSGGKPNSGGKSSGQCTSTSRANRELYVDERQAEIWTSEGRTSPTVVKVHAFRPRYFRDGEMERPCWLERDKATGKSQMIEEPSK